MSKPSALAWSGNQGRRGKALLWWRYTADVVRLAILLAGMSVNGSSMPVRRDNAFAAVAATSWIVAAWRAA